MKFKAEIDIMPLKELLDPQGKAVSSALHNIGLRGIVDVRIGKHIVLELEAGSEKEATEAAGRACSELLANLIMESYRIRIEKL